MFAVLKVDSSQLITCYLDQISTVSHTRLHSTERENNHGWAIDWQEAALLKKKKRKKKGLDFRTSPPNVEVMLLFNLKLSCFFLPVIKTRVSVCPPCSGPCTPLQWHQLLICQASHIVHSLPTTSHCSGRWLAGRAASAGRKSIAEDLQTVQGESSRNWPGGHCQSPNTKCKASQPWTDAISRQKRRLEHR